MCVVAAGLLLSACVTQPLYRWGQYDDLLYQGYRNPGGMAVTRVRLEKHIAGLEASAAKVAPGLYADLGTLYLQEGDRARARAMYAREREAWPESRALMDAMISTLDRRAVPGAGS